MVIKGRVEGVGAKTIVERLGGKGADAATQGLVAAAGDGIPRDKQRVGVVCSLAGRGSGGEER